MMRYKVELWDKIRNYEIRSQNYLIKVKIIK